MNFHQNNYKLVNHFFLKFSLYFLNTYFCYLFYENKNYKLPNIQIVDIGVKENGLPPEEIVTGFLARISEELEKYTLGLTKNLKDYFSRKKQKLIDDISKEEKKLKGIAKDVKNKLKGFGIE